MVKPLVCHQYQDSFILLSFLKLCSPVYNSLLIEKPCLYKYQEGIFESADFFQKIANTQFFADVSKE